MEIDQGIMIIGWIGMALIILAYYLLSKKKLKSQSVSYNLINALGGMGVLVSSVWVKLWPVVVLNIFWISVAVYSLIKIIKFKELWLK